jgi:uncharacterized cofD-like protein
MNKKVVVFGGGTGLSCLLKGLKEFPLDITAVVSVCDDGGSAGRLRDEFDTVAMGDIRRVLVAMSNEESTLDKVFNYRFDKGSLKGHTVGNIFLTGQTMISGSLQKAIEDLNNIFSLRGKVMPFTEDKVVLMSKMDDGSIVEGEHNITKSPKIIKEVYYKEEPDVNDELEEEIKDADMIVLSMGSLFTSVIPNLLSKEVIAAIDSSKAKIVYCCNLFTQPGETDGFKVSDHIKVLNSYLNEKKIEYVIANGNQIDPKIVAKYANEEQKDPVILDYDETKKLDVSVISDSNLLYVDNGVLRHDYMKLGYLIYSIALNYETMLNNRYSRIRNKM